MPAIGISIRFKANLFPVPVGYAILVAYNGSVDVDDISITVDDSVLNVDDTSGYSIVRDYLNRIIIAKI